MAVNFAAGPTASNLAQPPYAPHHIGYPPYEPSPDSSDAGTPTSFSPTSPNRSAVQNPLRQLRPPKKPLYVPAVLRPTERPGRSSPPKGSGNTSPDEPLTPPSSSGQISRQISPSGEDEETVLRKFLGGGDPSGGVSRIVTDEWNENRAEPVTGSPTKDHWKPDEAVSACDQTSCSLSFNILRRRHHCRRCGNIFCADHTRAFVPLDQHARFHIKGYRERACDACDKDFRFWQKAMTLKRRHSLNESKPASPTGAVPGAVIVPGAEDKLLKEQQVSDDGIRTRGTGETVPSSFVGSIGNLGNWSTF